MQEMSLLLQKENEPEQEKNQQASVSLHVPGSGWGKASSLKEAGLPWVLRM